MLSRVVNREQGSTIVSLMQVTPEMRRMITDDIEVVSLGATSIYSLLSSIIKLAVLIHKYKPSSIVCWMYHANVVAALAARLVGYRGCVVWNIRHSLEDWASESISTRTAIILGRFLKRMPSGAIFNSERSFMQHREFGYAPARSKVIPNGVEEPELVESARPSISIVGTIGRFHPHKDYSNYLVAAGIAARRDRSLQFVAAGRGIEEGSQDFMDLLSRTNFPRERMELLGELQNVEVFYRRIDVLVLSSLTEGFPNVLIEAMSYGVPCVTTDVGDAAAIVGESGIVVPPRDSDRLAGAITRMTSLSIDEYDRRSSMARARVKTEYSISAVAKSYDDFVNSLELTQ